MIPDSADLARIPLYLRNRIHLMVSGKKEIGIPEDSARSGGLNNDLILGAVGILQFDVAAYRLYEERWPEIRFLPTRVP